MFERVQFWSRRVHFRGRCRSFRSANCFRRCRLEALEERALLAGFIVNSLADSVDANPGNGVCRDSAGRSTLRAAIMEANALPGDDTILLGTGTYRLTIAGEAEDAARQGDLDVTDNLSIVGDGSDKTFIDASALDRVFQVFPGVSVHLAALAVTGGLADPVVPADVDKALQPYGAGIYNAGILRLSGCTMSGNTAAAAQPNYFGHGGAIYNTGGGTVLAEYSTFSNNQAGSSGSFIRNDGGSVDVNWCTVSSNLSGLFGSQGIAIYNSSRMTIQSSTLSNNNSAGIFNAGTLAVGASTISGHVGVGITDGHQGVLTLTGCTIADNHMGGLVSSWDSSSATISNTTFLRNSRQQGGALYWSGGPITLTDCVLADNTASTQGGAVSNDHPLGPVILTRCTISGNSSPQGGGIFGAVTCNSCTISGNSADRGGAVYVTSSRTTTIADSTLSNNTATTDGGAIFNDGTMTVSGSTLSGNHSTQKGGAIRNEYRLSLSNSTLAGNTADTTGGALSTQEYVSPFYPRPAAYIHITGCTVAANTALASGGGIEVVSGPVDLKNTIVAGNAAPSNPDIQGAFISNGHNLIGVVGTATGFTQGVNGDLVGTAASPINAMLGPLQNNGGTTQTVALLPNSPAIDAGDNSGAPATDQRGLARILDGDGNGSAVIDIGAYERFHKQPKQTMVGIYDPATSKFYLSNHNDWGNVQEPFGFGAPNWRPVAGDWNGDGLDTIGLFDPSCNQFYLRNANGPGNADISFGYGSPNSGQTVIMGDWNGDGIETVGLFTPSASFFELRNSNSPGFSELAFGFGAPGSGWLPIVGDWDADGVDTVGLYDPQTGMFYLRNSFLTGMADIAFPYGAPGSGWQPLIGDWNGDGADSAGFYQPGDASHFYLRDSFSAGMADYSFGLGFAGCSPVVGDWNGLQTAASSAVIPVVVPASADAVMAIEQDALDAPVDSLMSARLPTDIGGQLDAAGIDAILAGGVLNV